MMRRDGIITIIGYYAPCVGRYLRADPIGLYGGLNTYTYVKNNSLILSDIFGLKVTGLCTYYSGGELIKAGAVLRLQIKDSL